MDGSLQHIEEIAMTDREPPVWLYYCSVCKRKHYVTQRPCPSCKVYDTPQPVSDNVADACHADYDCDGCLSYKEHAQEELLIDSEKEKARRINADTN